jgi:DNA-binding LacI/PurR family transcriptional regulator
VIERLGYRPNRFAQGLMTRRSRVVGIVLPDIFGEF